MKFKNAFGKKRNDTLIYVFILIMTAMITYSNKNHLSELQNSVISIYEDRLVAKNYIFELSKHIQVKDRLLKKNNEVTQSNDSSMQALILRYEQTELTEEENMLLEKLKSDLIVVSESQNLLSNSPMPTEENKLISLLENQYAVILSDLESLSKIQLSEGEKLFQNSYQILDSSSHTRLLEIGLYVVLLLLIIRENTTFMNPLKDE